MNYRSKQSGVTLIEAILVLILIFSLLVLGIRQYQRYRQDNEVRQVLSQVDKLFQALAQYYQANCRHNISVTPNTTTTLPLTISSLLDSGYISEWSPIVNHLTDTSVGEKGFSLQLNGQTKSSRTPIGVYYNWQGLPTPPVINFSQNVTANITIWQLHVAMKLAEHLNTTVYKGRFGATCTSNSATTPCATATAGQYLIWESLPFNMSSKTVYPLSPAIARLRAFTNLYYGDDMYAASNPSWGNSSSSNAGNNYLCQ